jgi:hypothetical protein
MALQCHQHGGQGTGKQFGVQEIVCFLKGAVLAGVMASGVGAIFFMTLLASIVSYDPN